MNPWEHHREVNAWWRGENRLSGERNSLACCGPCSVCIPTVGMILGAEEGHCFSWFFFFIKKREMDGRVEEKKKWDRKRFRVRGGEVDLWPAETYRQPPQLGLLFEDGTLGDLLRVKSNPSGPSPSPSEPLECDKVRVQTLSGAQGSQVELGSDALHMFKTMGGLCIASLHMRLYASNGGC